MPTKKKESKSKKISKKLENIFIEEINKIEAPGASFTNSKSLVDFPGIVKEEQKAPAPGSLDPSLVLWTGPVEIKENQYFLDKDGKKIDLLNSDKITKKLDNNKITFNEFLSLSRDQLFQRNRQFYAFK